MVLDFFILKNISISLLKVCQNFVLPKKTYIETRYRQLESLFQRSVKY